MSNLPQIPTYNNQVVGQGLARLTSAFITQPACRAWLTVLLQPFQDAETALWQVLTMRFLSTAQVMTAPATNVVFDTIGALVGVARQGLADASLKALIYLRIAVNRSKGRPTDWSRFAQILAPFCDDVPHYEEQQASIYFSVENIQLPPNDVAAELAGAPGNGIDGVLVYTTWPAGNDFVWSSYYDSSAGEGTWGSYYDGSIGGLQAAGAQLSLAETVTA